MAKKRKLEVKTDPATQPEKVTEPINGSVKEDPLEDAAENETLPEDEQKPQLPAAAAAEPSSDPSPASAAVVDGEVNAAAADGEADDEPEPVEKLLEPLSKEQMLELLRKAADRHADVMEELQQIADSDPVYRKIFVHGLGWDTNAETLTSAFRQYGEIEDCNAVCDKISGKSKGYGFILFKRRSGARRALREPQKKIGNRMTACQMASAGPVPPPAPPVSEYTLRKIYVSNVSADIDPQKLLQFFSKYGEIEEGPMGLDKHTGKPKGFTLFVYKTVDSARKALEEPHKNFEGHILHCRKAIDGPKPNKPGFPSQQAGATHNHGLHHGPSARGGAHGPHFSRAETTGFMGGMGSHVSPAGTGHLMAPSGAGMGFNQGTAPGAAAVAGINPALGQALTALLTAPSVGLNILGSLGTTGISGPAVNQGIQAATVNSGVHGMQVGYGNQASGVGYGGQASMQGGYGGQTLMQGGYGNASIGQGAGRGQQAFGQGGVTHYMGH